MSKLAISTAQNVNIDFKIVGLGERSIAFFIDFVILFTYMLIVDELMDVSELFDSDWLTYKGFMGLFLLPAMFYSLYCNILFEGKTIGKMIMKLRVVRIDGTPCHWNHLLVRWVMRLLDIWMFTFSVGVLSILFSEKKQRVGDAAAGTVVISTKNKDKITSTILEDLDLDYEPVYPNVIQLTDRDAGIIKEVFQLSVKNADYKTLNMLRERVADVTQINSDLYDKQFIETVLKDYNYYTQQM
ncbi:hypothetical protein NBRC110019_06690 [Neptunitalea chrysea]|uniref:RDD domain-containing protein n=1 Tax=Neptunitalea chrysea TaxID=1647581 RepID=A0A9W6B4T0_9FLAO|nr:RDD family protein [Neptunitalea chrysea]GLB51630.1 hypothetical protein NBRC110019_06690 [Neptunitalea chrysea]